ncbi:MAG: hypothetical protein PGN25_22575 [Methylorubrum populi]
MTFFARSVVRTLLPPAAAALASMGAVLAVSTLAAAGGAERWSLRPKTGDTTPLATAETASAEAVPTAIPPGPVLRGATSVPPSDLPGERRSVRIVYQGYLPAEPR